MAFNQQEASSASQQGSNLGQTIAANRFVLSRRVGKGGFGDVYEGCDIWTNEDCAVKLVRGKSFSCRVAPSLTRSMFVLRRNELALEEVTYIVNTQRIESLHQ